MSLGGAVNYMISRSSFRAPVRASLTSRAVISVLCMTAAFAVSAQVRQEATVYHDDLVRWKLGQVSSIIVNGITVQETAFDHLSRPTQRKSFGAVIRTVGYSTDGTIATIADGNGNVTSVTGWKRGAPLLVRFPSTPEAPAGATISRSISDYGLVESLTDENGFTTSFQYDAMGRPASISYPGGDTTSWNSTEIAFFSSTTPVYGLPAGHWRRILQTGDFRIVTMYDAMWRPVIEEVYDAADVAGTISQAVTRYDASGRPSFVSYPQRNLDPAVISTWANPNQAPNAKGTYTSYDALGRTTLVSQDSELGPLTTLTEYIADFKTRVTNPRGQQSLTIYQVFDQPTYDAPAGIDHPEGASTEIHRDVFGKVTALRRRNADASVQAWRYYGYNTYQELCRSEEPETGTTLMGYDGAGNLKWSSSGLPAGQVCEPNGTTLAVAARRSDRTYDSRNRLQDLAFPTGSGSQTWQYWPDGLPRKITTHNDSLNAGVVENDYVYNKRRLLTGESSTQLGWYTWALGYGYDGNGSLSAQTYPTGLVISYGPNALGQATRASDQTGYSYAYGATYHPNGALKQFTYANGLTHSMVQNARQLPDRVTGSGLAMDFSYRYDANGNVNQIYDHVPDMIPGSSPKYRLMEYDGLDRLTAAGSAMFGGDHWHRFTYNALDNMTSWKLAGVKDYAEYVYNTQNRLTNIKNSAGASIVGFEYDPQGNLATKNGQTYQFDYGNRLRSVVNKENYRYDGYGRRVLAVDVASAQGILSFYGNSGQLMYLEDYKNGKNNENIYLAGSVVAIREWSHAAQSNSTKFQHTDALGSPVAVTNQAGTVIERNDYEPYGAIIGKPSYQGIGYTGHVHDGATGLVNMQQRYFDPQVAGFLSPDPAEALSNPQSLFHRYRYANANPFTYYDPSGMFAEYGFDQQKKQEPEPPPTDIEPVVVVGTRPEPAHFTPPDRPLDVQITPPTPQLFENRTPPINEGTYYGYVSSCVEYLSAPWEAGFGAAAGGAWAGGAKYGIPGARVAARFMGPVGSALLSYELAVGTMCAFMGIQKLQ